MYLHVSSRERSISIAATLRSGARDAHYLFAKRLTGNANKFCCFLSPCISAVNCCLIVDQRDDVREQGPLGKNLVSHRCDGHVAKDLKPFANAKCDCGDRYPAIGGFYEAIHVMM